MVFNWFRRQFNPSEDAKVKETETKEEKQPEAELTAPEVTDEPASEVTADYLNWAKSAYKNLQQQQQSPSETIPTEKITDSEVSESVNVVDIVKPINVEESVTVEKVELSDVNSPELTISTVEETSNLQAEPISIESTDTISNPLPFWAQEDRQARLERLKETAIEEEVPETSSLDDNITEELPEIAELPFDDGFLWSAKVLASQGRSAQDVSIEEISWLKKLRQGLDKTRRSLINQLKAIVGKGPLNQDAVIAIETLLLQADVGVQATDEIIKILQQKLREEVLPPEQAIAFLKQILRDMLDKPFQKSYSRNFAPEKDSLNIWLMTGVNGAGKTTTIGKIAHLAQKSGFKCLIGAADTFRAAAVEQVKIWGERSGIEIISNPGKNTDPAAVVFDAIVAAKARGTELLLVDTAGRLQNKKNLMDELSKIRRIVDKKAPEAKVESLLVLDSTLGQNGLSQAKIFAEAAKLSGVVLTKLDGTAKGGVAIAVVQQLGLPIRFIGAGEGIEDLRPFSSYEFIEALLSS